jgi:RimJ/RimL family protein N-acetyltransferase
MILREIVGQDISIIHSWPPYPEEFKDLDYSLREAGWISEYLRKDGAMIFVAEVGGAIIGFTILSSDCEDGKKSRAEFRIALHPDILGHGAGEKLAQMTIKKGFEELGLDRIYLIVRKSNHRARRLYQHCGFRDTVECRKEVNGIVVDFFEMELGRAESYGRMSHENDKGK